MKTEDRLWCDYFLWCFILRESGITNQTFIRVCGQFCLLAFFVHLDSFLDWKDGIELRLIWCRLHRIIISSVKYVSYVQCISVINMFEGYVFIVCYLQTLRSFFQQDIGIVCLFLLYMVGFIIRVFS